MSSLPPVRRLALVLGLSFVAACPAPVSHPDAGRPHDAGTTIEVDAGESPDAGYPVGPQPIGGACRADGDCVSGHCDLQVGGGYCIAGCSQNSDCPDGAACEQVGRGQGYCVALCSQNSDCRPGFSCPSTYVECLPSPGCQSTADCPDQRACDSATGLCAGAVGGQVDIGGACGQSSDCGQGPRPFCLTPDMGFAGGYCTSSCHRDGDCGESHVCVGGLVSGSPGLALCLNSCTADSDCRDQYVCATTEARPFCAPACHADADCIRPGSTCDASTGHCSGVTVPDGGSTDVDGGSGDVDGGSTDLDGGSPALDGGSTEVDGGASWSVLPAAPQVISSGGQVLAAPSFVPVFFSNDDARMVTSLEDFDSRLGATAYWTATTAEYGVGPATATAPVELQEAATGTIDDRGIQAWLVQRIGTGALPRPDANTIYVLHYPASVAVTLQGQLSCETFGAYHSEAHLADGTHFSYAVVPRCPSPSGGSGLDEETGSESHELIEAATDPLPFSSPAWASIDDAHVYWPYAFGGGELADMCEQQPGVFAKVPELPYAVQRTWSNRAAEQGRDPCVPEPEGEVYFDAIPELSDHVAFDLGGGTPVTTLGVHVPPGQTRTIGLDLYSDGDTAGPWTVKVVSASDMGGGPGAFTYTLDRSTGQSGDQLQLTIQASASAAQAGPDIFYVVSKNDQRTSLWLGLTSP